VFVGSGMAQVRNFERVKVLVWGRRWVKAVVNRSGEGRRVRDEERCRRNKFRLNFVKKGMSAREDESPQSVSDDCGSHVTIFRNRSQTKTQFEANLAWRESRSTGPSHEALGEGTLVSGGHPLSFSQISPGFG
jgi:hypothetical protein